jgi:hypothetical protein
VLSWVAGVMIYAAYALFSFDGISQSCELHYLPQAADRFPYFNFILERSLYTWFYSDFLSHDYEDVKSCDATTRLV